MYFKLSIGLNRRIIALLFALVAVVICSFCLSAQAYAQGVAVVTSSSAELKTEKSGTSAGTQLKPGSLLRISESASASWYTVEADGDGKPLKGYVRSEDVLTNLGVAGTAYKGTVAKTLSLSTYPGGPQVRSLDEGYFLQYAQFNGPWAWAVFDGKVYFFKSEHIKRYTAPSAKVKTGTVISSRIDLRLAPALGSTQKRSYDQGAYLQFIDFDDSYYAAAFDGVVLYFPKKDIVEYTASSAETLSLAVKAGGTKAYLAPSRSAKVIESYPEGATFNLIAFNQDWYAGGIKHNSKDYTVYFPASELSAELKEQWLITRSNSVHLYNSSGSSTIKTLTKGTILTGIASGSEWYSVQYRSQGTSFSGKVRSSDVKLIPSSRVKINKTRYLKSFESVLATQLSPNKNAYYNSAGKYASAPISEVRHKMNPATTPEGTTEFLQFLRLDKAVGVSGSQLNAILRGKGSLSNTGDAFARAAQQYGVNELYLIAHALHETGNGGSNLARGVYYQPSTGIAYTSHVPGSVKVYNMFGIGAVDKDPRNGGARIAYKNGWTSPEKAIFGGAKWIAQSYFYPRDATLSGQNTLYKMLWHPEYNVVKNVKPWHEYATDTGWALKQTRNLARMYADLDGYAMEFDLPEYN